MENQRYNTIICFKYDFHNIFQLNPVCIFSPQLETLSLEKSDDKGFTLVSGKHRVQVAQSPVRMDFYSDDILVISANARQLMRFEPTKEKTEDERNHPVKTQIGAQRSAR